MKYWKVALLAGLAMCIQDLLGTAMVVTEAHKLPLEAGVFDSLGWFAQLASTGFALVTISKQGWFSPKSLTIMGAITAANFAGTYGGVLIASSFVH